MFQQVTGTKRESGYCCERVRQGVPECCYQLLDGAELTFTRREREMLGVPVVPRQDGMFVLDRQYWSCERLEHSLFRGRLSRTLECASHPTRPVVDHGLVLAVAVIDGCNADVSDYGRWDGVLLALWQKAVDLVGVKPYYGLSGMEKKSWTIL